MGGIKGVFRQFLERRVGFSAVVLRGYIRARGFCDSPRRGFIGRQSTGIRVPYCSNSTRMSPVSTACPSVTWIDRMIPSRGAGTPLSIFIDSRVRRTCPA
jgi:hypothetical protein